MLPTANQIEAAVGCARVIAQNYAEPIRETCRLFDIDTGPRIASFLAQTGHESASFTRTKENLNYSADGLVKTWPSRFPRALAEQVARRPEQIANIAYGNRMGNKNPGDGFRYIGRGLIQITGLSNYEAITEAIHEKLATVPDFALHPELLESPRWAAISAGAYWNDHDLNELADKGDFARISKRINGGSIGAADRNARFARAMRVFAS